MISDLGRSYFSKNFGILNLIFRVTVEEIWILQVLSNFWNFRKDLWPRVDLDDISVMQCWLRCWLDANAVMMWMPHGWWRGVDVDDTWRFLIRRNLKNRSDLLRQIRTSNRKTLNTKVVGNDVIYLL